MDEHRIIDVMYDCITSEEPLCQFCEHPCDKSIAETHQQLHREYGMNMYKQYEIVVIDKGLPIEERFAVFLEDVDLDKVLEDAYPLIAPSPKELAMTLRAHSYLILLPFDAKLVEEQGVEAKLMNFRQLQFKHIPIVERDS